MNDQEKSEHIQSYLVSQNTDVFIYSGLISYIPASDFVDLICQKAKPRNKCLFFLTTPGGDPHAAFRMIRALRSKYKWVRLGIYGPCKSAGTLVALGAHEIVISNTGELGPLDVQVAKPDEVLSSNSGLDIFQALAVTSSNAFDLFEKCMIQLMEDTSGAISTRTAAEIAQHFVVGLFSPITAQIDPDRLGEVQRAIKIAQAYADKLSSENLKPKAVEKLVEQYPSHGFVIDFDEAKSLFKNVTKFTDEEIKLAKIFQTKLRHYSNRVSFLDVDDFLKTLGGTNGQQGSNSGGKPNIPKGIGKSRRNSQGTELPGKTRPRRVARKAR